MTNRSAALAEAMSRTEITKEMLDAGMEKAMIDYLDDYAESTFPVICRESLGKAYLAMKLLDPDFYPK